MHVVASDVELDQIQKGGGEAASRRVAEALIFATSMTMLKATGQVSSLTRQASKRDGRGRTFQGTGSWVFAAHCSAPKHVGSAVQRYAVNEALRLILAYGHDDATE